MISLTTLLITFLVGAFFFLYNRSNRVKLPPGPLSLPLIGSLILFGKQPFKKFLEWGDTYGKICTIGFGPNPVVLLSDPNIIREAFNDPRFSGRPDLESFTISSRGKHGVLNSEGQEWVEQRRFTLRHLRDFGFGKKTMETLIMEDVNEFSDRLKANEGQPISNVMQRFNLTVINSLWTIMSGERHGHEDNEIKEILENFSKVTESFGLVSFLLPKLAKRFPKLSGWEVLATMIDKERDHSLRSIQGHEKNPPEDGIPRDFMDSYLNEMKNITDPSSSFYKDSGIQSLIAICVDLFNAGTNTTSTTLTWTILYLAKLQDVQKKLQAELDSVVGRNRQISVADRPSLPYTEALILEILRHSSIVVFGVFHTTMEDVKDFHGYDLPKGTWIAANHYYCHHSPKYWDEPREFKPERFLAVSEDGKSKTLKKTEAFIPFSVGKRVCLGETLARDELFLFMTNIFQRFNARLSEDSLNVPLEHKPGVQPEPANFSVIFEERL